VIKRSIVLQLHITYTGVYKGLPPSQEMTQTEIIIFLWTLILVNLPPTKHDLIVFTCWTMHSAAVRNAAIVRLFHHCFKFPCLSNCRPTKDSCIQVNVFVLKFLQKKVCSMQVNVFVELSA
jgi:hypothetical protein